MDPELEHLADRAAAAVVRAMRTRGWEDARRAVGQLWRSAEPDRAGAAEVELRDLRADLLVARAAGDHPGQWEVARRCRILFSALLDGRPRVASQLRRLLDDELDPPPRYAGPEPTEVVRPYPPTDGRSDAGAGLDVGAAPDVGAGPVYGARPDYDRPPGPDLDDDEW